MPHNTQYRLRKNWIKSVTWKLDVMRATVPRNAIRYMYPPAASFGRLYISSNRNESAIAKIAIKGLCSHIILYINIDAPDAISPALEKSIHNFIIWID